MINEKWQWIFQPLSRTMRARLEICLGVVLTSAAMVGLSTVIRPDPSKLAPTALVVPVAPSALERGTEADLRVEPAPPPKVAPEFVKAVARGDIEAMEKLYTRDMPLDGMLSVAAESGRRGTVLWLLDHGADAHEAETTTDAPILVADEHPEIGALLRERGAKEPELSTAAQANAPNAVLRLIAAHAPVNGAQGAEGPLHAALATTRGTADNRRFIIIKLLEAGADANHDPGGNPLAAAAGACESTGEEHPSTTDCVSIIKLLVKHGAHATGDAILATLGLDEAIRDAPFDAVLTAKVDKGATAMALAQGSSVPPRMVKALVAKGIDWAWHDGEEDAALPVLAAVQHADRDYVRTLLDAGAPVDVHFKDGTCALTEAIDGAANNAENARIVELLVARGANVNRRLPDGRTPLFAAAESGEIRVINALLDKGARVNEMVLDDTALDAAERRDHEAAARVLHARGARRATRSFNH